ncbi:MAG: nucleotidyltransferase family protein [Anaerolineae bacterium]
MDQEQQQGPLANLPLEALRAFCQRWQIRELAVFGSILTDAFSPESDIDVLVTYQPGIEWTLSQYMQMHDELEALLGRRVDLVNRRAVERSRNPVRRRAILESARTIYAA